MAIIRVTTQWSGWSGAPGYTNFHFTGTITGPDGLSAYEAVQSFWDPIVPRLAEDIRITVQPEVAVLDDVSGELLEYRMLDVEEQSRGSASTGGYSAASGAVITWNTNTVNAGRRIRGRTFIVPLGGNQYEGDGTLTSNVLDDLREGASNIINAEGEAQFVIWSRPTGGGDGVAAPVTGYRVPDMAAVLRSRRD